MNRQAGAKRGSNLVGVREYNERLILQTVRMQGAIPKAQIARLTGLTAQTVSTIVSEFEAEGLLRRLKPQKGKVGQPSTGSTGNGRFTCRSFACANFDCELLTSVACDIARFSIA